MAEPGFKRRPSAVSVRNHHGILPPVNIKGLQREVTVYPQVLCPPRRPLPRPALGTRVWKDAHRQLLGKVSSHTRAHGNAAHSIPLSDTICIGI